MEPANAGDPAATEIDARRASFTGGVNGWHHGWTVGKP
jgi:hypothetical protein